MKTFLAISIVALSSLGWSQTSTAIAPDANKLFYRGAPAWSMQSLKDGVTIRYIDGTTEQFTWDRLKSISVNGIADDPVACTGGSVTQLGGRQMKGSILLSFGDGKRMCIPLAAKEAPAPAQQ